MASLAAMFGTDSVQSPRRTIRQYTRKAWADSPASSSQAGMNGRP
jgi:hypothetical protein